MHVLDYIQFKFFPVLEHLASAIDYPMNKDPVVLFPDLKQEII